MMMVEWPIVDKVIEEIHISANELSRTVEEQNNEEQSFIYMYLNNLPIYSLIWPIVDKVIEEIHWSANELSRTVEKQNNEEQGFIYMYLNNLSIYS